MHQLQGNITFTVVNKNKNIKKIVIFKILKTKKKVGLHAISGLMHVLPWLRDHDIFIFSTL